MLSYEKKCFSGKVCFFGRIYTKHFITDCNQNGKDILQHENGMKELSNKRKK